MGDPAARPLQAQVALGNAGLPMLCMVLHDERGDLEMVRGALECLVLAVQPGASGNSSVRVLRSSACAVKLHGVLLG